MKKRRWEKGTERARSGEVSYVCATCGGDVFVAMSRSYPEFLRRYLQCGKCGKISTRKIARRVEKV